MTDSGRHMACTSCRDRKVKCDGRQPTCQRCSRYSVHCVYMPPSKQSKFDVDLTQISDRLRQTEAALAAQQDTLRAYSSTSSQHAPENDSHTWANSIPSTSTFSPTELSQFFQRSHSYPTAPSNNLVEAHTFPLNDPATWDMSNMTAIDFPEAYGADEPLAFGGARMDNVDRSSSSGNSSLLNSVNISSSSDIMKPESSWNLRADAYEAIPQNVAKDLYRRYFDAIHPSVPMVDERRFLSGTDDVNVSLGSLGLRYAMWAHTAALSPIYANLKDRFYQQARECVEDPELEVSGGSLTITALQTHILLALYEFKETLFQRAWVSVSRATWLAQMLELHKMDEKNSLKQRSSLNAYLPDTSDPIELKERSATLWAALGLHCFVSVGAGWNTGSMLDAKEITTTIPAPDSHLNASSRPLTLDDALRLPATWVLSPYQGMIVVANICISCLSHIKQLHREQELGNSSYDFWTEHHHLDETIQFASANSLAHLVASDFGAEPNVLSLNAVLQATIICLHQAVITKAGRTSVTARQVPRSEDECLKAATKLSRIMRLVTQANVMKMNPLISWAIYVALQVVIRRSGHKPDGSRRAQGPSKPNPLWHSQGMSTAMSDRADGSLDDAKALDSMHFLLSTLCDMKAANPLAKVLESQISQEMEDGEAGTRERVVGLVDFPLTHPSTRSSEGS